MSAKDIGYYCVKLARSIYSYIPNWYKYGKVYRNQYKFLLTSEVWDQKERKKYQIKKLQELVKYCYDKVPYYKVLFDEKKINHQIMGIDDFKKIPLMTKEIIRNQGIDLRSTEYKSNKIITGTTGGTTGIPLRLYSTKVINRKDKAFVDYYWSKIGYKVKGVNKVAIIRGEKPRKGLSEKIGSKLILSSYMLKEENIYKYIQALEAFNPDYIHCFPSAIAIIAKYINEKGLIIKLNNLKGILTSSETLHDYQKQYLNQTFNVAIFDFYGQSENASIAVSIGEDEGYYFDERYAFNEEINGLIVSTGFINNVMPLLRYNTEDICSSCSNQEELITVSHIDGRRQDYLIGKKGEKISLSATNFHDDTFSGISEFQYEQNEVGRVQLRIVLRDPNKDLGKFRIEVTRLLGSVIDVTIDVVDAISTSSRGKKNLLIQHLKI